LAGGALQTFKEMKKAIQLTGVSTPEQFETLQFFLNHPDRVWAENIWHIMKIKKLAEQMEAQAKAKKRFSKMARVAA
jgi:hypothetical protein